MVHGCRLAGFIEMGLALDIMRLPPTEGYGCVIISWLGQEYILTKVLSQASLVLQTLWGLVSEPTPLPCSPWKWLCNASAKSTSWTFRNLMVGWGGWASMVARGALTKDLPLTSTSPLQVIVRTLIKTISSQTSRGQWRWHPCAFGFPFHRLICLFSRSSPRDGNTHIWIQAPLAFISFLSPKSTERGGVCFFLPFPFPFNIPLDHTLLILGVAFHLSLVFIIKIWESTRREKWWPSFRRHF